MVKPIHFSINISLIRILTNKETTVVYLNSELVLSIAYIESNDAHYYLIYLGYTRNPKPKPPKQTKLAYTRNKYMPTTTS